ncbi:hypothetical protein PTUN_a2340 [Pseudoalteromonas tunicata]|nr:hypothetical protein PTUN_a2340 [Pseudoalteromonas tunicata]
MRKYRWPRFDILPISLFEPEQTSGVILPTRQQNLLHFEMLPFIY